ncbi:MAG TPA: DUF3145 domain-containing protein [Candidatus Nanopelagicales bacterium]|nr:DUF3145 domain-containing protein [Candidatus Nanopelagicales bacterium]
MGDQLGTTVPTSGARAQTRGVVFVHSCPRALAAHVEWALGDVLGRRVQLDWSAQPVLPGTVRAELCWDGPVGTASRIVSSLHGWSRLRFEATEEATTRTEGERYSVTPSLGIFRAVIGVHGDVQVPEERLRGAIARSVLHGVSLDEELGLLLGGPWDEELEAFRVAGDGSAVRWLHQVVS